MFKAPLLSLDEVARRVAASDERSRARRRKRSAWRDAGWVALTGVVLAGALIIGLLLSGQAYGG